MPWCTVISPSSLKAWEAAVAANALGLMIVMLILRFQLVQNSVCWASGFYFVVVDWVELVLALH